MLTLQDLGVLRQALDSITLSGKDAKYIADLQHRLEQEILKVSGQVEEKSAPKK
jgi:hypothetical protein